MLVLEVACGGAHAAETVAPHVRQVVGIDLTPELVELGATRLRESGITNVVLQEGNAEALPFATESFDLVMCRASLHHFGDPRRALGEAIRVCKIGGRIAINDLVVPGDADREIFDRLHRLVDPSHVRCFLAAELDATWPRTVSVTHGGTTVLRLPIDIAITEQSDSAAVLDALRAELQGGPPTGFAPQLDDGAVTVAFVTHTAHAIRNS
jgi:SAM-dependent methyltransferase